MSDGVTPAAPAAAPADLPASAFPPGVDPATYIAQHQNVSAAPPPVADPVGEAKAKPQRPENVPEKFWDAEKGEVRTEALLKSYTELEKARSAPAADPQTPAGDPPPADGVTIERPADPAADPAGDPADPAQNPEVQAVATTIQSLSEKYAQTGALEDADFTALEKAGLPRQFVENYLQGIKALEQVQLQKAHAAAGGKDTFEAAVAWASRDLSDADLQFYNDNVKDPAKAASAVEWLVAKYRSAVPAEGKLVAAGPSPAPAGDVYRSTAQLTADMNSPQYRNDPAFREQVAAKLQRSREQGTLETNVQHYRA